MSHPAKKASALIGAPASLLPAEVEVWNDLAPHACAARTLVPATVEAFRDLCEAIVLKRMMVAQILADGLVGTKVTLQIAESGAALENVEKKAHALLTSYRGMMQRVEAGMLRFRLSPMGKDMTPVDEAPVDEWAEFDPAVMQ